MKIYITMYVQQNSRYHTACGELRYTLGNICRPTLSPNYVIYMSIYIYIVISTKMYDTVYVPTQIADILSYVYIC